MSNAMNTGATVVINMLKSGEPCSLVRLIKAIGQKTGFGITQSRDLLKNMWDLGLIDRTPGWDYVLGPKGGAR